MGTRNRVPLLTLRVLCANFIGPTFSSASGPRSSAESFSIRGGGPAPRADTLVDYEDLGLQPNPFKDGKEEPRIKLVFEFDDGTRQFHWTKPNLHPMSSFFQIASALLGDNPSGDSCVAT